MPFSLAVAGDTFQCKLDTIFNNIDYCIDMADDMIICSEDTDGSDYDKHPTKSL